jgi:hypothetical protein
MEMPSPKKVEKYVFWTVITSIFVICIIMFIQTWQKANESAYLSCLGSVGEGIRTSEAKNKFELSSDWKILDKEETNFLMSKIQGGDCSNYDNPVLDLWNHRINIALRKSTIYPEIVIWSNGRDGISRTNDDLVMPYGQPIPK